MNTTPAITLQRSTLEGSAAVITKLVLSWLGLTAVGVVLLRWQLVCAAFGLFAVLWEQPS